MSPLREMRRTEVKAGLECEQCKITYTNADVLDHVRLADAELLFCPQCNMAIAVVLDTSAARKTA